jgi:hypothetical protein
MHKIAKLIDSTCPKIFQGNWQAEHAKGWRWILNLGINEEDSTETVQEYQEAHGRTNVTVGHPFDLEQMKPTPQPDFCGLYVRDVEELITSLYRGMNDNVALKRWLEKEPDE